MNLFIAIKLNTDQGYRSFGLLQKMAYRFLLCLLIAFSLLSNSAYAKQTYQIGILAFQPSDLVLKRWQPIADVLNQSIPQTQFEIQALNYPQLQQAIRNKTVDFVFTNPASYIKHNHNNLLTAPLVSMVAEFHNEKPSQFGGVIVLPANSTIRTLKDLEDITIATPSTDSFGGYLSQIHLLKQHGVSPENFTVLPTGMPHKRAIEALLKQKANAAFVRTSVLEKMIQTGEIKPSQFKVLNDKKSPKDPFHISTNNYPEWPFIALKETPENISVKVTQALLSIPHNSPLTQAMQIHGFTVPADYQPVRKVLRELRVEPYNHSVDLILSDIWKEYSLEAVLITLLLILTLTLLFKLLNTNHYLNSANQALEKLGQDLKVTAASFHSQQPIIITNDQQEIIRINPAFTEVTGYTEEDVIGKRPSCLASGKHDHEFYQTLWQELNNNGFWKGEMWNRKKSGEIFPILQTITAIYNESGEITNYQSIFYDITKTKADAQHYKDLALLDPLTQLANRRALNDHLAHAIAMVGRNHHFDAVMFLDLDNFKQLNDTLGHHVGDILLTQIAERLRANSRDIDTVARLGGDEFVILFEELGHDYNEAYKLIDEISLKLSSVLQEPYNLEGLYYQLSASIGITIFSHEIKSNDEVLKQADTAMYQAKQDGKNTLCFYKPKKIPNNVINYPSKQA